MRSRGEQIRRLAVLPNSMDRFGRTIEPCVFAVAQEIALRAVSYGEKLLGDPALALTLFEEAAAKVSSALTQKEASGQSRIREMRSYLFRAYMRRIGVERRGARCMRCVCLEIRRRHACDDESRNLERRILVRELLDSCDGVTREVLHGRLEGRSWKEIADDCGISANAANLRFSRCLRRFQRNAPAGEEVANVLIAARDPKEEPGDNQE